MSWPYLPVNPECSTSTSCSTCPTTSDLLTYAGPNLSATGINACDDLSVALQKIDEVIGTMQAEIVVLQAEVLALQVFHP